MTLEAAIIISYTVLAEIVDAIKLLGLFFIIAYPITQALIVYCEKEDRMFADRMQQNENARTAGAAVRQGMHNSPVPARVKVEDAGGEPAKYLTNQDRELAKKLTQEARNAGLT